MDIGSKNRYPSSALSNFAPHPFVLDTVACASMEGLLQSLKFKDVDTQAQVCTLVGLAAKFRGKKKRWWVTQTLYWRGQPFNRHSKEYQDLLDRAYTELAKNAEFQKALLATGNAVLKHSIGNTNPSHTVLTRQEFTSRLTRIRVQLRRAGT